MSSFWYPKYGFQTMGTRRPRLPSTKVCSRFRLTTSISCAASTLLRPLRSVPRLGGSIKEGKLRAIGVSNFYPDHFIDLASNVDIVPMVNLVETHVFNQQIQSQKYMDEYNLRIMSWGPLAEGRNNLFTNPLIAGIGRKYEKSVAQVALRSLIQRGVIIIPKSARVERMRENLDIFNFSLTDNDMASIATLDTGHSLFFDHHDAEAVKMFMGWR